MHFYFSMSVSKVDTQKKARAIFNEMEIAGEFTASHGWLTRYLKRSNLTSRRVTGQAQKIPEGAAVMCYAFINSVHDLIKDKGQSYGLIVCDWHLKPGVVFSFTNIYIKETK